MLLISLTCDGLTGAVQERMKLEHATKSGHMMAAMNKWSCCYLALALIGTGEGLEFIGFIQRHPGIIWQLATFSVASALGQFFIFMCVSEFGPLPCSIITTTRKFFTVLGRDESRIYWKRKITKSFIRPCIVDSLAWLICIGGVVLMINLMNLHPLSIPENIF